MKSAGIALLSVYDKTGIEDFARELVKLGWHVYASGGTAQAIRNADIAVTDVAELVGGQAILDHRVVTLSREIYAGLLSDKTNKTDRAELKALHVPFIDLVCVDMYPLEEAIAQTGSTRIDVITQTDIGGPTLLRAAAKGHRIVLSIAAQRQAVITWLKAGKPNETKFLDKLAARAEYEAARYILASAHYLNDKAISGYLAHQVTPTKYGENPQQTEAAFYSDNRVVQDPLSLDQFKHIQGVERSFINMTDIDRLLQTVTHIAAGFDRNFGKVPNIAVGVKHGNACGVGVANTTVEAIQKMLEGDRRAIFGGVVMINAAIDKAVAEALMHFAMDSDHPRLLDGVIGASINDAALKQLNRSKLRVVVNPSLSALSAKSIDTTRRIRPVRGGVLEQPNYEFIVDLSADYMQLHGSVTNQQKRDIILAWAVGSTSNSNTITLVKNGQLIGNGVGQQDRVGAAQLALTRTSSAIPELKEQAKNIILKVTLDRQKLNGAVAYSDSFFPFPDGPVLLAQAGIKAILTSSGSVADKTIIKSLEDEAVAVYMVPDKIGRGFYIH